MEDMIMAKPYVRIDRENCAVLLVDHQSGLINMTRDFNPDQLRNRVIGLADLAKFFNLPVVLTTSFENGPNGPIVPELLERFPDAPYIARPGQINAWDNEDFVKAVEATGKKQLIIAGVVTEVCVAFPTLSALAEGYEVFVIADASATFDEVSRNAALDRMQYAGAQILTWFAAAGELQRDWRYDMEGFANILGPHIAPYSNLIQSFARAQSEVTK